MKTRTKKANDRAGRRQRAAAIKAEMRHLEALAKEWDKFSVWLATEPQCKTVGAKAALLEPAAVQLEEALARWLDAGDAALAMLKRSASAEDTARALRMYDWHRTRFYIANMAFGDYLLTWQLRAEQWRGNWPVKSNGKLVQLGDPEPDDYTPDWMTGPRRKMFWAYRNARSELQALRRRYVRLVRRLTSYRGADGARALAVDVAAHLCAMAPVFDAAFRMLYVLRDADVADDLLAERLPADADPLLARFLRDSEIIGRRIDDWLAQHPESKCA